MRTFNNKLMLKPYVYTGEIRANVSSGFATVEQKSKMIGLEVLVEAFVTIGQQNIFIPQGSIAYISEETLHTNGWSKKTYTCDSIDNKFILVDFCYINMIEQSSIPTPIPIPSEGAGLSKQKS